MLDGVSLDHLRMFIAAADEGSFSAGGRRLRGLDDGDRVIVAGMQKAKFFIDRPIFAIVIAILVVLAGGLSILSMPIEQYPKRHSPKPQWKHALAASPTVRADIRRGPSRGSLVRPTWARSSSVLRNSGADPRWGDGWSRV
jgi:hypothetical protein